MHEYKTILASAARTADVTQDTTIRSTGGRVIIDVTAIAATPSVVFNIQGIDDVSGKAYTILASAAITATGTTVLTVFPGATAAANSVANSFLPEVLRVFADHADTDSITYSIGFEGFS